MVLRRRLPQQPIYHPLERLDITAANIDHLFDTPEFQDVVAQRLSRAVQIPTVTYDGMGGIDTDPQWDIFYDFSTFLEETFPRLHKTLEITTISRHGLLYTWHGSSNDLKPLLFMAHSDVVPASTSTSDQWSYPPFSGHYDGEFVWGRGSEDDKSNLIAMMTAIDVLIARGFEPTRTLVLSIGFDEEGGAEKSYGARCLAQCLLETYGHQGIELIFDEGIAGIERHFGTDFALPATAEKGYIDVSISVDTPGGHSSTPPDHTAIGYLAQIIQLLEAHPFQSELVPGNPTRAYLNQAALFAKNMPEPLRNAILDPGSSEQLLVYMNSSLERRALVRTSTAVDVITGGDKVNSLPENASTLVNHRIAVQDSVQRVKDHYIHILRPWAQKRHFEFQAFGDNVVTRAQNEREMSFFGGHLSSAGTLTLTAHDELEPSPVSNHGDPRFDWLAGTLRGVFGEEVIVAPVLLTGNTDTKFFWGLSPQIYRMSPWRASHDPRGTRMHTVDERMPVKGLMEMVKFYHEFIRVVDEKRL